MENKYLHLYGDSYEYIMWYYAAVPCRPCMSRFRAQQVGTAGATSRPVAHIVTWSRKNEPFLCEGEEGLRPQAPVKPQRNRKAMSYDAVTPLAISSLRCMFSRR